MVIERLALNRNVNLFPLKKILKYSLRGLKIFIVVLVVLYIGVYIYVSANKKSIIKTITNDIGKKLNGEVSIGDAEISFISNFPKIAVVLINVSIKDTMFTKHQHPFFNAEKVYARLGIWKLIKKQAALTGMEVKNGTMYLYTDSTGYTNKYLMQPKKDTTAAAPANDDDNNELRKLAFINTRFVLDDREKGKLYDFMINQLDANIDRKDQVFSLVVRQKILVHNLVFKEEKGSFVKEKVIEGKYKIRYDGKIKQLQFDSINLDIGDHPFNLTGRFDIGEIQGQIPQMNLKVHTKNIGFEFAKSLLAPAIAKGMSIVTLTSNLDVSASITGPLKGGEQLVNAWWDTKKTNLKNPLLDIDNSTFTGTYTNEVVPGLPRKGPNSGIELRNFTGEWQGLPVKADKIIVTDFTNPLLVCDLKSDFALTRLNTFFTNSSLNLEGGDALISISYKGPIKKNNSDNSFVNGAVVIKNGHINYTPRNIPLKNVNGTIIFQNSDVFVQKIQCLVLNNQVVMDGTAKNLLTLMNTEPNKVVLDWNIYSPSLNVASFIPLLKARKNITVANRSGGIKNLSQKIDEVLERGSINVNLKADKLIYKKFDASNAIANFTILQNSWELQKVSLQHAGGQMDISGSLIDQRANYHHAKINVQLKDVDVSKTFAAFNNFGQDGITSKSIRGKLSAVTKINIDLNDDGNVYPSSVEGQVDFHLKNGALADYEPIMKIQDVVFKKRDFANVTFAELKTKLDIKKTEVTINRMEIQSSVLSMFVEGVFSTAGKTDISIQIPLNNLKKRDKNFVPENMGIDKKGGMSVFLRGTPGPDGSVKFKYDMFKKFRKDK